MLDKDEKSSVPSPEMQAATANELSEKELEDVSGGLWGITIIDTCQKKYDYNHCCNNFGRCPNLIINSEDVQFDEVNFQRVHHYFFLAPKVTLPTSAIQKREMSDCKCYQEELDELPYF